MKKIELNNKRILYLGPISFHYDKAVISKLTQLGACVDSFELHPDSIHIKFIRKLFSSRLKEVYETYFQKALLKKDYDYILVRHGNHLTEQFLNELRKLIQMHLLSIFIGMQ